MSSDRPPRKRVNREKPEQIIDPKEFTVNSCTQLGRKFHEYLCVRIEMWQDQHLSGRQIERLGIDMEILQDLAVTAIKHLLYYQMRFPKINVIQYPENKSKDLRIILQRESTNGILVNIVCEIHFVDVDLYEVTLVTAMEEDNFWLKEGQYVLLLDGESSILKRNVEKVLKQIAAVGI